MTAQQPPDPKTPGQPSSSRSVSRSLLWPATAVALGALLLHNSFDAIGESRPRPLPAAAAPTPATHKAGSPHASGLALTRSVPTRISIPAISVNAPFTPLKIGPSGQLNAPPPNNKNLAGWFEAGVTPGERGTSIVAGHVDTKTGPAVFVGLSELKPGNKIDITRKDGQVATFKVDSVEMFSKARFPNERVYNDTPSAQLRVITCGGEFDLKTKDYKDNVVVFAHLDSAKKASKTPKTPAAPKTPKTPAAPAAPKAPAAAKT
ncbi:class F sortase [Streptomyces sp. NPDC054841]